MQCDSCCVIYLDLLLLFCFYISFKRIAFMFAGKVSLSLLNSDIQINLLPLLLLLSYFYYNYHYHYACIKCALVWRGDLDH